MLDEICLRTSINFKNRYIIFHIAEILKDSDTVFDMISVKASICNVIVVLTHKDYLGQDEVRNRFAIIFGFFMTTRNFVIVNAFN